MKWCLDYKASLLLLNSGIAIWKIEMTMFRYSETLNTKVANYRM